MFGSILNILQHKDVDYLVWSAICSGLYTIIGTEPSQRMRRSVVSGIATVVTEARTGEPGSDGCDKAARNHQREPKDMSNPSAQKDNLWDQSVIISGSVGAAIACWNHFADRKRGAEP